MTLKRMALAALLILILVFLSPIAYLVGQRTGLWLVTPSDEGSSPWYIPEREGGDLGGLGKKPHPAGGAGEV